MCFSTYLLKLDSQQMVFIINKEVKLKEKEGK